MSDYCTGPHDWEGDVLPGYGTWHGCKVCQALGTEINGTIEPVKCTDCDQLAITLNHRERDTPPVPVCQQCFTGVIIL